MKEKLVMMITVGLICILLSSVMFLQFKTVDVIKKSGISQMSEKDLNTDYSNLKAESEYYRNQLTEKQEEINQYTEASSDEGKMKELLKKDVEKVEAYLGYKDVKGPGIILTLSDGDSAYSNSEETIKYYDLLFAINELQYAGAEAISINDERYVNTTYIASIQSLYMVMNGQRITSPYTIKVIGDSRYLESVINMKGGLKDQMQAYNKKISYTVEDEVFIGKYNNLIEINYGE